MVLAVQAYSQFHQIGLDTSLGAIINMSVVRELGPVLAAIMLAGRVGSAMAAELATMRVTEQIDALACLGVDPVHYLVAPRFLACCCMIPLLTVMADLHGHRRRRADLPPRLPHRRRTTTGSTRDELHRPVGRVRRAGQGDRLRRRRSP